MSVYFACRRTQRLSCGEGAAEQGGGAISPTMLISLSVRVAADDQCRGGNMPRSLQLAWWWAATCAREDSSASPRRSDDAAPFPFVVYGRFSFLEATSGGWQGGSAPAATTRSPLRPCTKVFFELGAGPLPLSSRNA